MVLGDLAVLSDAERAEWYRVRGCVPTPDEVANNIPRVAWLKKEHQSKPFTSFLDVGCHDGFASRWLLGTPECTLLVGIDPCVFAIECAEMLVTEAGYSKKAAYIAAGFEEIQLKTRFSGVCFFELIEHFTPAQVVASMEFVYDHLEVGGRAYFSTPHIDGKYGKKNPDAAHINLFDEHRLLAEIGSVLKNSFSISPDEAQLRGTHVNDFIYVTFTRPLFDAHLAMVRVNK